MGKFFNLGDKITLGNKTPEVEPVPLGVESAGTPAAHLSAEARANVEQQLPQATARRGRPRKDGTNSASDSAALQAKVNAAIAEQLDALHAPEAWEALLCLPADAALTLTGGERWKLENRERKTLGITGSAAARTMMITNPRALAFFMLGSALFATYIPRAIGQLKEMREKQEKKDAPKAPANS